MDMRRYTSLGLLSIVTLIDSDMPSREAGKSLFTGEEVVSLLHDEGDDGRIFKMPAW